jgi:carbonic anhydrase
MKPYERLLLENVAWAQEKRERDPGFFENLREPRTPDFFWIGCSDSRVHADEITHTEPGEIFVHRNLANQVVTTDMNLLAALEYAVDVLRVRHVIVCGHYGCGAIKNAMGKARPNEPLLNKWVKHVKDVYRLHRAEIESQESEDLRCRRLVELNVIEQVNHLAQTSIIQKAWRLEERPDLHGWVYGVDDGLIREIATVDAGSEIDPLYEYAVE